MTHIVISLGSNLGNSKETIEQAIAELLESVKELKRSTIIETKPWGKEDQPNFFNAVITGEYERSPYELLSLIQSIEANHNRTREVKWGPRTLDLDIIAFGEEIITDSDLTIPHPFAHEREFVLAPWLEIEPEATLPGRGKVADLLDSIQQDNQ
jgi:2-amino-4-hydroxy-6-hydroxymethyldihydropteridine diphosphokinase